MIDHCKQQVLEWKQHFPHFTICLDTSQDSKYFLGKDKLKEFPSVLDHIEL